MRWSEWWAVALVLGGCAAQPAPTVCHDESCRCDSFTRVICNCTQNYDEVTLRPDGAYRVPSTATAIIISGCARVYFLADTARALPQLRLVRLEHVRHVYLAERALAAPRAPRARPPRRPRPAPRHTQLHRQRGRLARRQGPHRRHIHHQQPNPRHQTLRLLQSHWR
ncbi:unnamed protein product [Plutella xylostella]|uniref:(diamondback moth) hypothetical protein n=1 Tax=Plutella xylostella TaxID=51655 RepID=A0A8S4GB64_PLUXY|nr:unnamed protein product [Plutella xylostella]